jgi:transcriptional regulator with XRE-family HTH domain
MALTIGKAIKILRDVRGKSLGDLADQAKISVPYLSLVEADKRNPSLDVIGRVAEALEVPSDIFLLIGSGSNNSLSTSNDLASRLMSIFMQMEKFEKKIKDAITQ